MNTQRKMMASYKIKLLLELKPRITVSEVAKIIKEIKDEKMY